MYSWQSVYFLSIFDHWLSVKQADDCSTLCYATAVANDALDEYLQQEQYFIDFYRSIDNKVIIVVNHQGIEIDVRSERFLHILQDGLREKRHFCLLFPKYQVMFESGYDRTDRMFITNQTDMTFLQHKISEYHLYLIDGIDYQSYLSEDN
ncbi:hypothetical protein [Acinetobacter sp. c3-l95]|uniref:hypothetical protein n=1 Tax=Acinetobacter sp. c3-l95 TaxID=3342804 RepID=UPI0035BB474C